MTTPEAVDDSVLVLEQVSKHYTVGQQTVLGLDRVDVRVAPGEFVAVVGPSGSGKSTLLHCASGLDSIDHGRVVLSGVDLTGLGDRELTKLRRSAAGFIFQAYNLISSKTSLENIVYPLRLRRQRPEQSWLDEVVDTLGIAELLDRYPNHMSGGQQQRVAVARSMVSRPNIVFADEPTGALDSTTSADLLDLFVSFTRKLGQSVMMVTHDLEAAARADRIIRMLDGTIEGETTPTQNSAGGQQAVLDATDPE